MQYCSSQHQTLLLSPVTSTAGYYFCFGSIPSFFLELFLHRSPVEYWAPTDLGSSSFIVLSFCLFILFMGFSRQEYGLPFPSPGLTTFSQTSPNSLFSYLFNPTYLSRLKYSKCWCSKILIYYGSKIISSLRLIYKCIYSGYQ